MKVRSSAKFNWGINVLVQFGLCFRRFELPNFIFFFFSSVSSGFAINNYVIVFLIRTKGKCGFLLKNRYYFLYLSGQSDFLVILLQVSVCLMRKFSEI